MLSIIAPTMVGAFLFRRLITELKTLFAFICITFVLEVIIRVFYELELNNMPFFHLYSFIEFGFITAIYYLLSQDPKWKKGILGIASVFILLSVYNLIYLEGITEFNSNQRYVEGVTLLVFFFGYFFQLMSRPRKEFLESHPFFILTLGLLAYFTGTLLLFLFSKELLSRSDNSYWALHGILNILLNLTYTIVLWKGRILKTFTSY